MFFSRSGKLNNLSLPDLLLAATDRVSTASSPFLCNGLRSDIIKILMNEKNPTAAAEGSASQEGSEAWRG